MSQNTDTQVSPIETASKLGLLEEEYHKIVEILGREPNFTELSIYSVMWSEHCSYKNSIKWLKTLPKDGPHMLAKAGEENAGLVAISDDLACAFKIESHNHPSAIEPYQGAATGVGGINRDIFTMGARPIAQLNSLRFGNLNNDRMKYLLKGVVKGIGDYGNAFGIPTVGGEVYFDECYNVNILVNAMSAGIVEKGKTISAISYGVGNPVFIVGAATGKDGIHGATFASGDLHDDSHDDLPSVQVGDPFTEKLLLEATLELIDTGAVVGMQDMGAAGIICSTSEMSAKGKHGMKIFLDKVPTRQSDMKGWEILLSESQERMLVVGKKGMEDQIRTIFDKWDLNCTLIGEVIEGDVLKFHHNNELIAEVPAESLVLGGGAPIYERTYKEPSYFTQIKEFNIDQIKQPSDLANTARQLVALPNIASKKYIYTQYDSMVGTKNMSTNAPSDAAIVNLKNTNKAIALTVDCNSRYVYADPYVGCAIAVSEAARNIICSGGEPSAITNCLNFGNPYNPEVYYQFVYAIKGMSDACTKYKTPVTGGNVSFYNQSNIGGKEIPVFPTPTIGMLGIIEDKSNIMTLSFKNKGDSLFLIGASQNDISSSQYLVHVHNVQQSPAPYFNLDEEFETLQFIKKIISKKLVSSAHDISEGGLFVACLESAMESHLGFSISCDDEIRKDAFLFGEAQGRVLVSVSPENMDEFIEMIVDSGIEFTNLGNVTEGKIEVDDEQFGDITEFKSLYDTSIDKILESH
ncbi:MAG TPA: phosphoribosylformylglycinamidine synthase subunit PurL [Bacteroidia bacterium]|nr:phosphoribosylformylglycinamidine synthase subunit PurL [Bacteroidia bacterium]